ncbi:ComF family protein [Croceitalea dokdonensis]|uniref:ComF family protein n=1 Tax=Croceitalea dokdonensis TaxID=346188 RepID=UPI001FE1AF3A|nr:ComF family protein [Croceitalea dokdonensis]
MPPACFGCNVQLIGGEELLCTTCRYELPLTEYNFSQENHVDRIFYGRVPIKKASSFLYFSSIGIVKNLLHQLKYKNQSHIGIFLGSWYGALLAEDGSLPEIDYVVPVPLHPKKLRKRGYNQVTGFGKQIATAINATFLEDVLTKTANTKTQTKKSRIERWQEQQSLFKAKKTNVLTGKKVLLVDDVITTGATIEVCARALLDAQVSEVYVATMAIVP